MLSWFERRVDPYPPTVRRAYSRALLPFLWQCAEGLRGYLLAMTILTGLIGAFEALLFSMLGRLIDWMGRSTPEHFLAAQRTHLWILGLILAASPLVIALQAWIKYQAITPVFPMRLRWIFHQQMLNQSMSFFHDEFAGRIAAKVMQTALAVRDAWVTVADILVYVVVYLITVAVVVAAFDAWLLAPFVGWVLAYGAALAYFVPRLGKVASNQADARSLMTGRVTDAYTNISTIKLFAHGSREELDLGRYQLGFLFALDERVGILWRVPDFAAIEFRQHLELDAGIEVIEARTGRSRGRLLARLAL